MSNSLKTLFIDNLKLTALFCILPVVGTALFWPMPQKWMAVIGIIYGAMLALCSLYMICIQSASLAGQNASGKGMAAGYLGRYLMYGVFFFIGAVLGIPILSMLIGAVASKLALFVYARKDSGQSESSQIECQNLNADKESDQETDSAS